MNEEPISFRNFIFTFFIRLGSVITLTYLLYLSWIFINYIFDKSINTNNTIDTIFHYIPVFISLIVGLIFPLIILEFYELSTNEKKNYKGIQVKRDFIFHSFYSLVVPLSLSSLYLYFLQNLINVDDYWKNLNNLIQYIIIISVFIILVLLYFFINVAMKRKYIFRTVFLSLSTLSYMYYLLPLYMVVLLQEPTTVEDLVISFFAQILYALMFLVEIIFALFVVIANFAFFSNILLKIRYGWQYIPDNWKMKRASLQRVSLLTLINYLPVTSIDISFKDEPGFFTRRSDEHRFFTFESIKEANKLFADLIKNVNEQIDFTLPIEIVINYADNNPFRFQILLENNLLDLIQDKNRVFEVIYANRLVNHWAMRVKLNKSPLEESLAIEFVSVIYSGEVTLSKIKDINQIIITKLSEVMEDLQLVKKLDNERIIFHNGYEIQLNDVAVAILSYQREKRKTIPGFVKSIDPHLGIIKLRTKDNDLLDVSILNLKNLSQSDKEYYYNELIM